MLWLIAHVKAVKKKKKKKKNRSPKKWIVSQPVHLFLMLSRPPAPLGLVVSAFLLPSPSRVSRLSAAPKKSATKPCTSAVMLTKNTGRDLEQSEKSACSHSPLYIVNAISVASEGGKGRQAPTPRLTRYAAPQCPVCGAPSHCMFVHLKPSLITKLPATQTRFYGINFREQSSGRVQSG